MIGVDAWHGRARARAGMAAMVFAMGTFSANDTIVKAVASDLPIAQTMALRGTFATLIVLAYMLAKRDRDIFRGVTDRLVTVRALAECLAIFCLIAALTRLPIGDVTALSQCVPLILLPAAAIFLKEHVSLAKWLLVGLGFCGVLMVAKPGQAGFDPAMLLVAVTAACFAFRDFTARSIAGRFGPAAITLSTVGVVAIVAMAVAFWKGFQPMALHQVAMLALAALLLAVGQAAVVLAFRWAPVSVAGPFNYSKTAFALVFGLLVFGEVPDLATALGMALIVAAGLGIALLT